jgi:hypothetical protein
VKWLKEVHGLVWTAVGTGLCLIALSGTTRRWGMWITGIGLAAHLLGVLLPSDDRDKS